MYEQLRPGEVVQQSQGGDAQVVTVMVDHVVSALSVLDKDGVGAGVLSDPPPIWCDCLLMIADTL